MLSFFSRELRLITVLLLTCDSYISGSTRFVSLKLCVGFSIFDSVWFNPFSFLQDRRKLFLWWRTGERGGGGDWVKRSATMVSRRRRIKKKPWLNGPKVVPQKALSGIQRFYICPDVPVDIIRVCFFLISDFPPESVKANKNYQKDHTFYNTDLRKKIFVTGT